MTISIDLNNLDGFTLDESFTLQNSTATPGIPGDADDEDVARSALQTLSAAFDTLLYTTLGFDTTFGPNGRIAISQSDLFTVTSDGTLTDVSLSGEYNAGTMTATPLPVYDGTNFGDGGASGLTTTDDEVIRLFSDILIDPDGPGGNAPFSAAAAAGLGGNVIFGVDSSGDFVLAILMVETVVGPGEIDLQFAMVTNEAIKHPDPTLPDEPVDLNDFISIMASETSGFSFIGVPPGKAMFLMAAALSGPGGVLVTPLTEVVEINTSNAFPDGVIGFGSQGINAGETVAISWVAGGLVPDFTIAPKTAAERLDQNESDVAVNIHFSTLDLIDQASFAIQQKVGSATAAVRVTALATGFEDGSGSGDFFDHVGNAATVGGAGDDTLVDIDSVTFTRGGMDFTRTTNGAFGGTGVTVAFVNPTGTGIEVVITGLLAGDVITYETMANHSRTLVTGVSGNVDIGAFSSSQTGEFAAPAGEAFNIEDAAPSVDVMTDVDPGELAALSRNLDETIDPDDDQINDGADNYATGEAMDDNGDLDDVPSADGPARNTPIWDDAPGGFDDVTDQAIGRLESTAGQLSALFASASSFVDFGTDGPGDTIDTDGRTDTLSFDLSGAGPVLTNLVATAVVGSPLDGEPEADRQVHLVQLSSTVVEGIVKGPDGNFGGGDDYVIIRLTLTSADDPANATIVYEQFAPVQNPNPALFDEAVNLLIPSAVGETLSAVWTTVAEDGDEDTDMDSASVTLIDHENTIMSIDDDGPRTTEQLDDVLLWEDGLPTAPETTPIGISDNDTEAEDTVVMGDLRDQVIGGTDGVKEFGWTSDSAFTDALDALGHSSGGVDLVHSVEKDFSGTDDRLIARKGPAGPIVYEVVLEADGDYTAKLFLGLDHDRLTLPGQDDEDEIEIDLHEGLEALEGDNDPAEFADDALVLVIEDDEGQISGLDDTPVLPFASTSTFTDSGFLAYGADGPGSFKITDFTDLPDNTILGTITGSLSANDTVLTYTSSLFDELDGPGGNGEFLQVTLVGTGSGSYTFDVLQDAPLIRTPLIGGSTTPGGPIEEFTPPAPGDIVTFDGFLFTDPFNGALNAKFAAGDDDSNGDEDVNISKRGAALEDNQFDFGEGLALFFDEEIGGLEFIIRGGTGGGTTFDFYVEAYDDGVFKGSMLYEDLALPKGNKSLTLEFLPEFGAADEFYFVHDLTAPNGFRIPEIFAFQFADVPDLSGTVTVQETDFDDDPEVDTFAFFVDGNGDMMV